MAWKRSRVQFPLAPLRNPCSGRGFVCPRLARSLWCVICLVYGCRGVFARQRDKWGRVLWFLTHLIDLVTITHMPTSRNQLLINLHMSLRFSSKRIIGHTPAAEHPVLNSARRHTVPVGARQLGYGINPPFRITLKGSLRCHSVDLSFSS